MNDQIYQDLKSLHLSGMAQSWMLLHETRKLGELTLQDGMAVLIQAEHDQRTNNRTARLLSRARFRYNASIEELAFNTAQGRDKNQILSLATCEYIKQGASVLVTGPAGVGKSFIASALGHQACFAGYKVRYANMQKLLEDMHMARIESKAARFFDKMAALDLLIIDDFGMKILDGQQLLDFMELIEDRHGRKSTIIASQLPVKNWYDILAKNPTIADAVLDRVVKSAYRIELNGVSMKK